MNRDKELYLLEEALSMLQEKKRPNDGEESLFATTDYTDPVRFDAEIEHIFKQNYNVVTLSSHVRQPGDFITAMLLGAPIIVVRGKDEQLRAFLNVCRHRGATLEPRAHGNCKRFICPYHAWTYNIDGSLNRVRHPEGFPTLEPKTHGLVELPCIEIAGLVMVCPNPNATPVPPPQSLISELEHMLGPRPTSYASTTKTWDANWKIIVEGGIESYHFSIAHKDTIAPFFGDTLSTWEPLGPHIRSILPKRSLKTLADQPRDQWTIRDHTHILYSLHPNATILLQKTYFDLIIMTPMSPSQTQIKVLTVGTAPEEGALSQKAQHFMQQNHDFSIRTLDEDFEIGAQIQRGIATGANTHFRFARFEGALTHWRQFIDASMPR